MTNMKEVRGLAWWLFWRYTLLALLGGVVAGAILGVFAGIVAVMAGFTKESIHSTTPYVGAVAGVVVGYFALNFLLSSMIGKKFGNKRLVLVDAE